jgi:hypothetical protein
MQVDWFAIAALPLAEARQRFGIVAKSDRAIQFGTTSPWGTGGISPTQLSNGRAAAAADGRTYDSYGATAS